MSDNPAMAANEGSSSRLATLKTLYSASDDDIQKIQVYGDIIVPQLDAFVELFYDWLRTQPEFEVFFPDDQTLSHVQTMFRGYWEAFFRHDLNEDYLDACDKIGETHARIGLPLAIYLAAMHKSLKLFTEDLYDDRLSLDEYLSTLQAVTKRVHLDTSRVVETYARISNEVMLAQTRTLMQMSTPGDSDMAGRALFANRGDRRFRTCPGNHECNPDQDCPDPVPGFYHGYQRGGRGRYRGGQLSYQGDQSHPVDGV